MSTLALIRLISDAAILVGAEGNTYVVGGAPRDCLLGFPVKDIDVVVEDMSGTVAPALANAIAAKVGLRNVHPDQYGVVHVGPFPQGATYAGVDLSGEKVEIVTARAEKYDKSLRTGSHKPVSVRPGTLEEDLRRRDFTFNTLAWPMASVPEGPFEFAQLQVVDLLEGVSDLRAGRIKTPINPRETFAEDPSRMLRAVRFAARFDFQYALDVENALASMGDEMRRLPFDLLDGVLCGKILTLPLRKAMRALSDLNRFGLLKVCLEVIPETRLRRVVDAIPDLHVRLLALRHGFPSSLRGKLTVKHFEWLFQNMDTEPLERLTLVFDRFVKPPVDANAIAIEKGLSGAAIGRAVTVARDLLLQDPFVDPKALHRQVVAQL